MRRPSLRRCFATAPISLLAALPNAASEVVGALKAGDAPRARTKAQGWIYSGYKMTIFSTAEEQQREPIEIGGKVFFLSGFRSAYSAGGDVSVVDPWNSHVLQDRELISGQDPFSDEALHETSSTGTQREEKESEVGKNERACPRRWDLSLPGCDADADDRNQRCKSIHVRVGGHGPAVVYLVHGFGTTGDMWGHLASLHSSTTADHRPRPPWVGPLVESLTAATTRKIRRRTWWAPWTPWVWS